MLIYARPEQGIHHRNDGNEDEHPHDAHQAAADGHCRQHPDGREAYRASHDLRIDKVPLDLLEYQEHDNKDERLERVHHKDEERAHDTADERSEDGDQRCKCDEHAHQQGVGHIDDAHDDEEHRPQYKRLHALPGKEAREGLKRQGADFQAPLHPLFRQECVHDFLYLHSELLLLQEHIAGEYKCDDKGRDAADDGCDGRHGGVEHIPCSVLEKRHRLVQQPVHIQVQAVQPSADFFVIYKEIVPELLHLRHIHAYRMPQGKDGFCQFRDNDEHDEHDHTHDDSDGEDEADRPCEPLRRLLLFHPPVAEYLFLQKRHRHVQDKCDAASQQERKDDAERNADPLKDNRIVPQCDEYDNGKKDKPSQLFDAFIIQIHTASCFRLCRFRQSRCPCFFQLSTENPLFSLDRMSIFILQSASGS